MPKIKTRKAAAKRFSFTKKGKLMRRHAGMRHLLAAKKSNSKRQLGKEGMVSDADAARVKSMLPGRG
ncbi:MAG: 50S ribosomal protein L35 [Candidatus Margulisbacteria bacterium]|nr:50S ribosomal protein L35 [Candidatus Margulisiibacteriota bacterium]